ncbi:DUF2971 domain-containing protein [Sphingobacterium oryzagri]|uniref:DUF2971 domain-containing protein n=1 Tax=Sphingobacterium oryzagri TaxID=3025669 RepID=UPI003D1795BB
MWAHYGGLHCGVCLEFDEDLLVENLKEKYSDLDFHLENVEYSNRKKSSFLHWQEDKSHDENYKYIVRYLLKRYDTIEIRLLGKGR